MHQNLDVANSLVWQDVVGKNVCLVELLVSVSPLGIAPFQSDQHNFQMHNREQPFHSALAHPAINVLIVINNVRMEDS